MDTLTHALSGVLVARATARAGDAGALSLRDRLAAGFLAAAFPDIDHLLGFVSPLLWLAHHRGVTHSLLLLPFWAALLALAMSCLARDARGARPWLGICALALAAHIAGDLITSFGTMVLAPVSNERFAFGTTFIIDPWFTGIILAGLVASLVWRASRRPALLACGALVLLVVFQAAMKHRAERFALAYAQAQNLRDVEIRAYPRPLSPFHWTVFVSDAAMQRYAHVSLVRGEVRPDPGPQAGFFERFGWAYRPLAEAQWAARPRFGLSAVDIEASRAAWRSDALAFFRWFADRPAFEGTSEGGRCAWFSDLRFLAPGRRELPFRFGACRDAAGEWRAYQRAGDRGIPLYAD